MEILIKKHYPSLDNEKVILYEIEINDGDKIWRIEKRFNQFKQLNQRLSEYFGNTIPLLPKQTYTTFIIKKTEQEIIERKKGLEEYLKQIIQNEQIEFIHSPSFTISKLQLDSVRTFDLGLRDFYFYEDAIFVLLGEMSPLNRATTSFQNMKLPWQEEIDTSNLKPLGYLDCLIGPQMIWRKKYNSQPICMSVIKDNILIGLDNGIINHLQFKSKKHLLESNDYQQHTSRIMGLHIFGDNIYSVSKDQRYRVMNIKKSDTFIDLYHKHELTCLRYDESRDYAFIGDRGGIIYAYQQATLKISLDTNLQFIRDLIIQKSHDTIVAIGFQTGQAIILNIFNKVLLKLNQRKFRYCCNQYLTQFYRICILLQYSLSSLILLVILNFLFFHKIKLLMLMLMLNQILLINDQISIKIFLNHQLCLPSTHNIFQLNYQNIFSRLSKIKLYFFELLIQEATQFKNKIKSRCIAWSLLREEVYIGNQEGFVTVWDIQKKIPIYEIQLHNGPITKIHWNDEEEMLYTASKDKTLKITFFNKNMQDTQNYQNRQSGVLQNFNL